MTTPNSRLAGRNRDNPIHMPNFTSAVMLAIAEQRDLWVTTDNKPGFVSHVWPGGRVEMKKIRKQQAALKAFNLTEESNG